MMGALLLIDSTDVILVCYCYFLLLLVLLLFANFDKEMPPGKKSTQLTFTCLESLMETSEKCLKSV